MKTAEQIAQELETHKPIDGMHDETWEDYMRGRKMTREEAVVVLKTLMKNPLFSEVHKVAFNIAIHDIKQYHDWNINNLMLVHKDNIDYSLFTEFKEKLSKWMYLNSEVVCGDNMIDIDYLEGHIDEILYEMGVIGEAKGEADAESEG